jgi:hypothetical protein
MSKDIISLFIFLQNTKQSIIVDDEGSDLMINPNQIKGKIGETLEDDIAHLKDNSVSLKVLSNTEIKTGITGTGMQTVFDMASLVDPTKSIVLVAFLEVKNTSTDLSMNFEIINYTNTLNSGIVEAGQVISLSSERSDLIIKADMDCEVTYTIKYI